MSAEIPTPKPEKNHAEIVDQIERMVHRLNERAAKLTDAEPLDNGIAGGHYNYGLSHNESNKGYFVGAEHRSVGYIRFPDNFQGGLGSAETQTSAYHVSGNNDPNHQGNKQTEMGFWINQGSESTKLTKEVRESGDAAQTSKKTNLNIEVTHDGKIRGDIEIKNYENGESRTRELNKQQVIKGAASVLGGLRGKIAHAEKHRKADEQPQPDANPAA